MVDFVCSSWCISRFLSRVAQELNGCFKPSPNILPFALLHLLFEKDLRPKMLWMHDKPLQQHPELPCFAWALLGSLDHYGTEDVES